MSWIRRILGIEEWKTDSEYFFILTKEIYEEIVKLAKEHHPNEFFFYIFAKTSGKFITANRVVESKEWFAHPFGPEERSSKYHVSSPTIDEVKNQAKELKKNEVLVLCHTHVSKEENEFNLHAQLKGLYRPLISKDINLQRELVSDANIPPETTLFGIFLMPKKNEKKAYEEMYESKSLSFLIVRAPSKRERLTLGILSK